MHFLKSKAIRCTAVLLCLLFAFAIFPAALSQQQQAALQYLVQSVPAPTFGIGRGEWTVLALARSGYAVPNGYYQGYYDSVRKEIADKTEHPHTPQLDENKSTENSRLILALSALGVDARQVNGYNLLLPLSDYAFVTKRGINGAVFALLALDSRGYAIPNIKDFQADANADNQTTKEKLLTYILNLEINGGGFALSEKNTTPEPEMTAMVLLALLPYAEANSNAAAAIARGLVVLEATQKSSGGYVDCENTAQVLAALSALGIDAAADNRFQKAQGNPLQALLAYQAASGGFTRSGSVDPMTSDQATYALVAYDRYRNGKTSLYNCSDAPKLVQDTILDTNDPPSQPTNKHVAWTKWESTPLHWFLFIVCFGWIWMSF
jgi:hypothetical protein